MERFSYQKVYSNDPHLDVKGSGQNKQNLLNATNSDGKIWLEILVDKGDARSFDLALSFNRELSWYYCMWDNDGFKLLKECVSEKNDHTFQTIFDGYEHIRNIFKIYHGVAYRSDGTEDELLATDNFTLLRQEDEAKTIAARLMQFVDDWESSEYLRKDFILRLAEKGFSQLFRLFYDANKTVFWEGRIFIYSIEDKGEYIQPELSIYDHENDKMFEAGLLEQSCLGTTTIHCINWKRILFEDMSIW